MARHARLGPLLAAIALAAAAVACGDDGGDATAPPGDGATRPSDEPSDDPDGVGPTTPDPDLAEGGDLGPFDFVAEGVQGGQVVGAELAGSEVVVWFWAPW